MSDKIVGMKLTDEQREKENAEDRTHHCPNVDDLYGPQALVDGECKLCGWTTATVRDAH